MHWNVWEKLLNWIFQTDATLGCKFDLHQSCRAWLVLSYCCRAFLNPFSEFREKLTIIHFTIRNVLKCMENVWEKFLNWIIQTDATIECKSAVN